MQTRVAMSWARVQGCPTPSLRAGRTGSACGSLHSGAAAADSGGRHLLQRGGSAAAHAASAHRRYLTWLHGEIMLVVFVGLVPFGVFMAYARKSMLSRWWFQVHRAVQVCSSPPSGFPHAHLHPPLCAWEP